MDAAWTEHDFDAVLRVWPRLEAHLDSVDISSRPVAVLDIDDTVLQCHGERCTPVPLGLKTVRALRRRNIPFFYVTARRETQASEMWARMQLHMLGLDAGCAGLRLMPPGTRDVRAYKAAERRYLEESGYRVVLNMGDQWTDFDPCKSEIGSIPSSYYGWRRGAHALCVKAPHRLLGAPPPPAQAPGT